MLPFESFLSWDFYITLQSFYVFTFSSISRNLDSTKFFWESREQLRERVGNASAGHLHQEKGRGDVWNTCITSQYTGTRSYISPRHHSTWRRLSWDELFVKHALHCTLTTRFFYTLRILQLTFESSEYHHRPDSILHINVLSVLKHCCRFRPMF